MDSPKDIYDIFKTKGAPTVTYVKRLDGKYEKMLSSGVRNKGTLCLLTGPSKTGKTTLYHRVAAERGLQVLQIRCNKDMLPQEFWRQALEKVDFNRIEEVRTQKVGETKIGGEVEGKFGFPSFAGFGGKATTETKRGHGQDEVRKKVLSDPSPDHLVSVLVNSSYLLVVEDFHYLNDEVKTTIFQQWKIFIDNEVSVIVVGTTHHAVDLAYANEDLIGRVSQVDLSTWTEEDLSKIAQQGFDHLKVSVPKTIFREIASESVGLPIVTQAVCLRILENADVFEIGKKYNDVVLKKEDVYKSLHEVATSSYSPFEEIYVRLSRGPRERSRKYNTYDLILTTFTQDPLTFVLTRSEIDNRLQGMKLGSEDKPPAQSISVTLNALENLQKSIGVELLEWSSRNGKLYILEPTLLFYLRWRVERKSSPKYDQILSELLERISDFTFTDVISRKNEGEIDSITMGIGRFKRG